MKRGSAARLALSPLCALAYACSMAAPSPYRPTPPLSSTAADGRSEPPPELARPEHPLPALETFVLPNGLRVVMVARGAQPLVTVRYVALAAGREHVSEEQVGLPELTAQALVSSGTKLEDGGELRDVGIGGARIEPFAEETFSALQFQVGSEALRSAVALLARTVRHPLFAELSAPRAAVTHGVAATRDLSGNALERLLSELLFDGSDRRAVRRQDWLARLRAYDDADLRGWHARYAPARSALIVVGRFDPAVLRAAVQSGFGDYGAPGVAERSVRPATTRQGGDHLLPVLGSVAVIALAYRSVAQDHPDYWCTELLAHALGATPSAGTWRALRHGSGLT